MRDSEAHEFMYRVTRGSVRVEKGDPRSSTSRTAVVNHLPAGATFGEMSFLDGAPACATCLADSENVEVGFALCPGFCFCGRGGFVFLQPEIAARPLE
mmetsp:Transcript_32828/g.104744  ORF Transcript_32828/g.104744 Transcript_32828/m.104744 type:complete len:98 (-) Transcript_32828:173-466(-)